MTPSTDPYRVLGLPRSASIDDVKRAYRALAKANHPDAAGPSALPRFLAIQGAYEQLVDGTGVMRGRPGAKPAPSPARPSAADPDRADATNRAYGGRARRARPAGSSSSKASSSSSRSRSSGPASSSTSATGSTEAPKRERGKATLGSTSYDGADAGQFEPDWGGASWYGTTSGTYWTINPKEYADPRKHGPEYQARAHRAARARGGEPDASPTEPEPVTAQAEPSPTGGSATTAGPTMNAGPTHTTASWWDSAEGDDGSATASGPTAAGPDPSAAGPDPSARRARGSQPAPPPPDIAAAAGDLGRALTDERSARGRWRVVQAVVGWVPIALGLAWLIGEVSGCGRFAASCNGGTAILSPILGVATLALLLVVPRLAAIAAAGAIALMVAAVPTALVLSATGTAVEPDVRSTLLGVVLIVGWSAGIAVAVAGRLRAATASPPDAPVS